jgi:hypothetical protein
MVRKLLIMIIACMSFIYSSGQQNALCNCDSLDREITEPKLIGDVFLNQTTGTVSQYFMNEWLYGIIYLSNHMIVPNKILRYNGYLDRLIWLTDNYQHIKLDKESIDGFCLFDRYDDKSYYFQKIRIKEELSSDSTMVYAQLLCKGNISLFAYRKVVHSGTTEGQDYQYMIDEFEKKTFYYFKFPNNTSAGFRHISKRNIVKAFPGQKNQVLNLLRTGNQHSFKTEEDLIQIAELLNGTKWY